ncbi:hypothetical protein DPMN_106594 [Dreissena polymorpha]|uniref:Uncharacterized protein n=1 Tax=Dreissena polymorpha TaxID=45954 RepID=A0A9D4K589_DREPO|nr:hypothetical protein DPMN_106594 [Dreissena polymorpha]
MRRSLGQYILSLAVANPTKPEEEIWSDIVACGEQDNEICIIDEEQNKFRKTSSEAPRLSRGNKRRNNKRRFLCCADTH